MPQTLGEAKDCLVREKLQKVLGKGRYALGDREGDKGRERVGVSGDPVTLHVNSLYDSVSTGVLTYSTSGKKHDANQGWHFQLWGLPVEGRRGVAGNAEGGGWWGSSRTGVGVQRRERSGRALEARRGGTRSKE